MGKHAKKVDCSMCGGSGEIEVASENGANPEVSTPKKITVRCDPCDGTGKV
ncbi:hypothetical protein [Thermomonospora umbrina]|uniref:Uncharacterized protein n=1 Tax=Thermomonospora umbrina TaxID=111806 RepID=A0A3D9SK53_9ACTN|nr:hypothetical protein [Thermomonospora umbrina]REE96302.1 hypothetical protein DFJ69_1732 [Thermomonospora umbrina]